MDIVRPNSCSVNIDIGCAFPVLIVKVNVFHRPAAAAKPQITEEYESITPISDAL